MPGGVPVTEAVTRPFSYTPAAAPSDPADSPIPPREPLGFRPTAASSKPAPPVPLARAIPAPYPPTAVESNAPSAPPRNRPPVASPLALAHSTTHAPLRAPTRGASAPSAPTALGHNARHRVHPPSPIPPLAGHNAPDKSPTVAPPSALHMRRPHAPPGAQDSPENRPENCTALRTRSSARDARNSGLHAELHFRLLTPPPRAPVAGALALTSRLPARRTRLQRRAPRAGLGPPRPTRSHAGRIRRALQGASSLYHDARPWPPPLSGLSLTPCRHLASLENCPMVVPLLARPPASASSPAQDYTRTFNSASFSHRRARSHGPRRAPDSPSPRGERGLGGVRSPRRQCRGPSLLPLSFVSSVFSVVSSSLPPCPHCESPPAPLSRRNGGEDPRGPSTLPPNPAANRGMPVCQVHLPPPLKPTLHMGSHGGTG